MSDFVKHWRLFPLLIDALSLNYRRGRLVERELVLQDDFLLSLLLPLTVVDDAMVVAGCMWGKYVILAENRGFSSPCKEYILELVSLIEAGKDPRILLLDNLRNRFQVLIDGVLRVEDDCWISERQFLATRELRDATKYTLESLATIMSFQESKSSRGFRALWHFARVIFTANTTFQPFKGLKTITNVDFVKARTVPLLASVEDVEEIRQFMVNCGLDAAGLRMPLWDGSRNMVLHCELQVIDHFIRKYYNTGKTKDLRINVHVTKPCCFSCAVTIEFLKKNYPRLCFCTASDSNLVFGLWDTLQSLQENIHYRGCMQTALEKKVRGKH